MYVGSRSITPHQNLNSYFANLLEFYFGLTFVQLHHLEDSKLLTLGKVRLFPSNNHRDIYSCLKVVILACLRLLRIKV
jgi:hypothetical protein